MGLALVPGDAFGGAAYLRISYAASMETLQDAVQRLAKALDAHNFTSR